MPLPLQVSFRNMGYSEDLAALVRQKAAKLDTFSDRILGCRVVVEPAGKHHRRGNPYAVRIDLTVPGQEIVTAGEPARHAEARDVRVALRDAFDAARRQLEDFERRRRGAMKAHQPSPPDG